MNPHYRLIVAVLLVLNTHGNLKAQSMAAFNEVSPNMQRGQLHNATRAQLKTDFIKKIKSNTSDKLSMVLSDENGKPMIVDFSPFSLLSENFKLTDQNGESHHFDKPQFFKGEIQGGKGLATMTVFKDRISAVISTEENGNIHIAQDKESKNPFEYWIYNDHDWMEEIPFECHTIEDDSLIPNEAPADLRSVDQCVEVYLEADYFMFQDYGTVQGVMDYISEIWVHIAALYEVEEITLNVSEIFVWTSNDPYSDVDGGDALLTFSQTRTSYNGDLAHLLSTNPGNLGGIAFLDVLCTDVAYGFSNITNNYSPLPNYSWTVNVLAHEIGHQLGAYHTHSCLWPNGPIDNCAPVESGPCNPGPTPTNGGTIMSYCHLTGVGIDFNNGFGSVAGDHIRARVSASTCLAICNDGGNGNPPVADFAYNYLNTCEVGVVAFSDASSGNPTTYSWQFEGGNPSSSLDEDPVVQYISAGVYSVTLTVTNANGIDSEIKNDVITIQESPSVSYSYSSPNDPNTIEFVGIGSNITTWLWEFGDGTTSTLQSPTHTYSISGTYNVLLTASNACGTTQENFSVSVDLAPVARFSQNKTEGCAPLSINFLDQSLNNPTSHNWQLSGGTPTSSTFHSPFVTYQTPGVYDVILQVTNSAGFDTEIKQNLITVEAGPIANFVSNINGATAVFANTSLNANSIFWDFGDGSTSTSSSPAHTYVTNGNYIVTLTVDNDCGTDIIQETITISAYPDAGFTLQSFQGCSPHTANFINVSTNSTSVVWQFPGGTPANSTSNNPAVVYQNPGVYNVTMTVSNSFGSVTETFEDIITISDEPLADFAYDNVGLNYSFENESLYGVSFIWDFGDGNFSTEENPQHSYTEEGTYRVDLEIAGLCGTSIKTRWITIFNTPSVSILPGQTVYCVDDLVSFDANISSNATEFLWTITGPETHTSDEEDPVFFFSTTGLYSVELEVSNPAGSDVEFLSNYLTIRAEPEVDFSYDVNILQVSFQAELFQASTVLWSFGDGTTSSQHHPTHQYVANGDYLVSLTAFNECGATSYSETITLDQLTFANFSADQTSFCQGEFVQFQNMSTMSTNQYSWSFPGGTPSSSTEENPIIFYNSPGVFDVSLYVENGITNDEILINDYIQVDANQPFEIENTPLIANIPTNIRFNYTNDFPGEYLWDYGDGQQSNVSSPVHNYINEGSYQVSMSFSNSCFEMDTTFLLHVYSKPKPEFIINNNAGCVPFTVIIDNLSKQNYDRIEWSSPGSIEGVSTLETPIFTYLNPGEYDVTLKLSNPLYEESLSVEKAVNIIDVPVADFSFDLNGFQVNFNDESLYNSGQTWNFGDGGSSVLQNPTHTYPAEDSYAVNLVAKNVCGRDTLDQVLDLFSKPVADFTAKDLVACRPANISFESLSSDNSLEYEWIFEGAQTSNSSQKDPMISYNEKGVFDVVLIVSNPLFSDTLTLVDYITIHDVAETNFDFNQSGFQFNFTNLSVGALSYQWDFGDGTISQELNPSHEYSTPGNYFVSLTTTNACGVNVLSVPVEARSIPAANFSVSQLKQCKGSEFIFYNLSDDGATEYDWSFPGSTIVHSSDESPVVIYNDPGFYDVSLIAHSAIGSDTISFNNYIEVQEFPIAAFTVELIGNELNVTNSSIGADDYLWISGTQVSMDENPIFSYHSNGDYTIELNATNSCGTAMASRVTTINALPQIDFIVPERACVGETIFFESLSANVDNVSWYLNGEIVGSSSESFLEVTISEVGIYDILLVGVNQYGQSEILKEQVLEIVSTPIADFEFSFFGDQILFTDLTQFGVDYFWDFGDGFIAITGGDQFHFYSQAGIYEVGLMVENECGSDTIVKTIDANILLPQPVFFSNHDLCVPTTLEVNNESIGDINSWYWRLSGPDTIESFLETPLLDIVRPGSYDLYIEFANQYGGVSEFYESYITIQDVPEGAVEISLDGAILNFANTDSTSDNYLWNFGDGFTEMVKAGSHIFAQAGTYDLSHTASNVCGETTYSESLTIEVPSGDAKDVIDYLRAQPSPTEGSSQLELRAFISESFEIHVINSLGQLIEVIEHPPINGVKFIDLPTKRLPRGIYHIWIKAEDYRNSTSVIKI